MSREFSFFFFQFFFQRTSFSLSFCFFSSCSVFFIWRWSCLEVSYSWNKAVSGKKGIRQKTSRSLWSEVWKGANTLSWNRFSVEKQNVGEMSTGGERNERGEVESDPGECNTHFRDCHSLFRSVSVWLRDGRRKRMGARNEGTPRRQQK